MSEYPASCVKCGLGIYVFPDDKHKQYEVDAVSESVVYLNRETNELEMARLTLGKSHSCKTKDVEAHIKTVLGNRHQAMSAHVHHWLDSKVIIKVPDGNPAMENLFEPTVVPCEKCGAEKDDPCWNMASKSVRKPNRFSHAERFTTLFKENNQEIVALHWWRGDKFYNRNFVTPKNFFLQQGWKYGYNHGFVDVTRIKP